MINIYRLLLTGLCCLGMMLSLVSCGETPSPPFSISASWLAPGFDRSGWPTIGYDSTHSGQYPARTAPLYGHVAWQYATGGSVFSAPVLANGTVYVGSNGGNLLALDAQTGVRRWQHAIGQYLNDATPVAVGRVVFVPENRTWISALDAATGHQLWATDLHELIKAPPTYASGLVLVNATTTTFALDARNGTERWHFHENANGWPTTAAPTVQGQSIYIAQGTTSVLYALNLLTGQQLWKYDAGDRLISTPLVVKQEVVIGTWKGKVAALNTTTGSLLWSYNINSVFAHGGTQDGIAGALAATNGSIFVGTYGGTIFALAVDTGHVQWRKTINAPVLDIPVVAGNTLYVSGGQTLYALALLQGLLRWQLPLGDIRNDLALGPTYLYAATVQGNVYAVN